MILSLQASSELYAYLFISLYFENVFWIPQVLFNISYKLFQINRGDILLFRIEKEEVVKKIIGFPNEKIEVEGKEITIGNNEVYIIGINLPESIDSRNYGPILKKQILGKVVLNF